MTDRRTDRRTGTARTAGWDVVLGRALRLRCPRCGGSSLFRSWFRMHDGCPACGLAFAREPGFYLGSIYVNYGVTVIVTGALYAALVLGAGLSHEWALAIAVAVAVLLPVAFFRHARSLLLALDTSVNRQADRTVDAGPTATAGAGPLPDRQLAALAADDASAGCLMGAVLALVLLFGLGMALATIWFSAAATPSANDPATELDRSP
jgi:uncharacterized protein (DUF983 family)